MPVPLPYDRALAKKCCPSEQQAKQITTLGTTAIVITHNAAIAIMATVRLAPAVAMRAPTPARFRRTLFERLGVRRLHPVVITAPTYAWAGLIILVAAVASALVVRRRIDRLDLVEALKSRE